MNHEQFMLECIRLAKQGMGKVAPNPMVGSVIVCNNKIIGNGFHENFGGPHGEVNAINSVENKSDLKKSTLYVNLEPCSHYGKTPPCADLIVKMEIPRVVIGAIDDHSKVAGKGVEKLKKAGIDVILDICKSESIELNKRFYTFHRKKRPFIILKWAETEDGFISRFPSDPVIQTDNWITNDQSKKLVHEMRCNEDAILVGHNTVITDNPLLTTRLVEGKNPTRIVLSKAPLLDENLAVFNSNATTINFNHFLNKKSHSNQWIQYNGDIKTVLNSLYDLEIQSVIIEGGTKTLQKFINENLWDEALVFVGNKKFQQGIAAPTLNTSFDLKSVSDNILKHYKNYSI